MIVNEAPAVFPALLSLKNPAGTDKSQRFDHVFPVAPSVTLVADTENNSSFNFSCIYVFLFMQIIQLVFYLSCLTCSKHNC